MIYVDDAIHPWKGQLWCHLFSPDIDALHAFAGRIGLKRTWFQDPRTMPKVSWPHYDMNENRRRVALAKGAIALDRYQTSAMSKVVLNRFHGLEGTDRALDPLRVFRNSDYYAKKLPELEAWLEGERAKFAA